MMTFELPALPYELNALEPFISTETLQYHYGKHHRAYIDKLNELVKKTPYEKQSLEQVVQTASGTIFNNAAQAWNHTFYWHCLTPQKTIHPSKKLLEAVAQSFQSLENFKEKFIQSATTFFGSGWTWLVKNKHQELSIINTQNAETPIQKDLQPLLTCDVWEHAYYIDYRNARLKYLEAFWQCINWEFVSKNL